MKDPLCAEPGRTAVGAGEEHLFDVGRWSGRTIDSMFVIRRPSVRLSSHRLIAILANGLVVFGNLGVGFLVVRDSTCAEGWHELDTVFVKSQCMPEVQNCVV